jgi:hypothetical protein
MKVALAPALGIPILVFSFAVQAVPGSPRPMHQATGVTLAMGCGKNVGRTHEGGCKLAGQQRRPMVARPVNGKCPPGTQLGINGGACVR